MFHGVDFAVLGNPLNPISHYIAALEESDPKILEKLGERGGGEYRINFAMCKTELKTRLFLSIIRDSCGELGCRIWRLLRDKKKLDEKMISKIGLIHEKAVRTLLYKMLKIGMVFIQDVPKSQDYSVTRTSFLWYISIDKTTESLIQSSYKALSNLKIRNESEIELQAVLLNKTKRSDILEGSVALSVYEMEKLQELQKTIRTIHASESRLDKVLILLRDW